MLDIGHCWVQSVAMTSLVKISWKEFLVVEGLPLTCKFVVYRKNRGIKDVSLDGNFHPRLSGESRRTLVKLVETFIVENQGGSGLLIDYNDLANYRRNEVTTVEINFRDGTPSGRKEALRFARYIDRCEEAPQGGDVGFTAEW